MDEDMDFVGDDADEVLDDDEDEENGETKTYLPGEPVAEGSELVCDDSAYVLYHQAQTGAPCLSFDVLHDQLGDKRCSDPYTAFVVCGTQANRSHLNNVIVMKMSNLRKNKFDQDERNNDDDDNDENSDEELDEQPELEAAMVKHIGGINRLRTVAAEGVQVAATWSDTGKVHVWDLTRPLAAVNDPQIMAKYTRTCESPEAIFTFSGHQSEGFALDWSPTVTGQLATGDCRKDIHVWTPAEGGTWRVDQKPFVGHSASVEDIQWSPNEANVFASCSVDKSIRIWDARVNPTSACMLTSREAHDRDVNVISWNRNEPFIVSGGDDGILKIWDLRLFQEEKAVAIFKHHSAPVTSVEWHPHDSTVFAAAGSDDQLTQWDLSVERDQEAAKDVQEENVPPQLLFIHQGQQDIKELHWHPQIPGVIISTAHSGFNIFRTISV